MRAKERRDERAEERMAQCSTRQFLNHSTHRATYRGEDLLISDVVRFELGVSLNDELQQIAATIDQRRQLIIDCSMSLFAGLTLHLILHDVRFVISIGSEL